MVLANLGNVSPPLFNLITLITYLFSLLLCACLACPCACLCLPTVAYTPTLPGVLAYQHTWLSLFWISFRSCLPSHQSFFVFFYLILFIFFFTPPLGLVTHFSLFTTLLMTKLTKEFRVWQNCQTLFSFLSHFAIWCNNRIRIITRWYPSSGCWATVDTGQSLK